jgi:hypothetical protein
MNEERAIIDQTCTIYCSRHLFSSFVRFIIWFFIGEYERGISAIPFVYFLLFLEYDCMM